MKRPFDPHAALRELVRQGSSDRFDISIDYQGHWYYKGSRIDRLELVKLFATVLQQAPDGSYWLITPVEQGRIDVADAPFVIVAMQERDDRLEFTDNIDRKHALVKPGQLQFRRNAAGTGDVPYLKVEGGLKARLLPAVYYELADMANECGNEFGVMSGGVFHAFGQAH